MNGSPELPPRPQPPKRLGESLNAWLAWFGVGRLVVSAICVVAIAAGGAWLLRAPAPTTEAGIPFVGPTGSPPSTPTLVPPSTPPTSAVADTPATAPVFVHVAGSVRTPGLFEVTPPARVHDAIEAAGGPTVAADLDGLNLAAPVTDGQRVYVPAAGEVDPTSVPQGGGEVDATASEAAPTVGPIDLNVATVEQLETLPGIGPSTAAAIIDDRDRHGPFATVADLERVPGIGPAKLAAVVDLVTV